jgi:hypothetical protein
VRRRKFITLVGGAAAAAWPLAARAQQPASIKRIGVLMGYAEADVEAQSWVKAFASGLQERGWADGSTVRIDYRWATGSLDRMRSNAAELVGLKPNMILAGSTPALSAVRQENSRDVKPVMLPPGFAKLETKPCPMGSATFTNTIGTDRVSCLRMRPVYTPMRASDIGNPHDGTTAVARINHTRLSGRRPAHR